MPYEEPDEVALGKLAWLIAEEFVETYRLLDSLDRATVKPETPAPTVAWSRLRSIHSGNAEPTILQKFLLLPSLQA